MQSHKDQSPGASHDNPEEPGQELPSDAPLPADSTLPAPPPGFPIVAIGASAGGLEAIETFLRNMRPDSGAAFIVVQHLSPDYKSMMAEILRPFTKMKTLLAEDGLRVEPDTVYTMQPGKDLLIEDGLLRLADVEDPRGQRKPIDRFFSSLAQDQKENAICVLLSGTGSDGALSLREVKELGGFSIAQNDDARFKDMPRSAIATGMVDYILTAGDMPEKILDLIRIRPVLPKLAEDVPGLQDKDEEFRKILGLLKLKLGHDFSLYKHNTIARRIQRRMVLLQIRDLNKYAALLKDDPAELKTLFQELLIGVTNFFRDPGTFETLAKDIIPRIFAGKPDAEPVRVWVAGCSTGEEAYSIAMLVFEFMAETSRMNHVQIFATDLDEQSLNTARDGVYPKSIEGHVSSERLARFFVQEGKNYKIKKNIREMIVFAQHSMIKDPPYSRLDLISCRNLFIYLSPGLQGRILPLFHYALNPDGFLFLGPSESVAGYSNLFLPVDRKAKIFQRQGGQKKIVEMPLFSMEGAPLVTSSQRQTHRTDRESFVKETEKILLEQFVSPSVVVNEQSEALRFFGRVENYFRVSAGESSSNVLNLAKKDLRPHLRAVLQAAMKEGRAVRRNNLSHTLDGATQRFNLLVTPLNKNEHAGRLYLVIFEYVCPENPAAGGGEPYASPLDEKSLAASLEQELHDTREELQTTIEEVESSNEELKSSNEELMSMNEEMQSSNEELETSREELHSINEELVTVNSEMQLKVDELAQANSDLQNFMNATKVATLFLGKDNAIRLFTPQATAYFNILNMDVGRPFDHLKPKIDYPEIQDDIRQALADLIPVERQIHGEGGVWTIVRIMPYRTTTDQIDGVVVTLLDVTPIRFAEQQLSELTDELLSISRAIPDIYIRVGKDHRVLGMRTGGETVLFRQPADELIGKSLGGIFPGEAGKDLESAAKQACEKDAQRRIELNFTLDGEERFFEARILPGQDQFFVIIRDMTDLRKAEVRVRFQSDALAQVSDALVAVDANDAIILWNGGAERTLGIPAVSALGKKLEDVPGARWIFDRQEDSSDAALEGTLSWSKELASTRPDGKEILIESSVSVIRGKQGEKVGLLAVLRDITERKRFENDLLLAKVKAEEASQAKSEFLAKMSHEIRTPMNGILGLTELILLEDIPPAAREYFLLVKQSGLNLLAIINDVLDISKIESGQAELAHQEFDLRGLVESTLSLLDVSAANKGIHLAYAMGPGVPGHLVGDQGRLRQVLSNLVGNAVKFTPKGEVVLTIGVEGMPGPRGVRLLFRVTDTGIGIAADNLGHIFENFTQASSSAHIQYGGTGLGLSISKSLVEMMGGTIWVESEPDKGSTFSFTAFFGLAGQPGQPEPETPSAAPALSGGLRILLAEDDSVNQIVATEFLKRLGHRFEVAANGIEALEKLTAGAFDLVLMDVRMPEMSGLDAVRAIRRGEAGQDKAGIKVVALTAHALAGDRERLIGAGFDDYISKPIDTDDLDRVLARITR